MEFIRKTILENIIGSCIINDIDFVLYVVKDACDLPSHCVTQGTAAIQKGDGVENVAIAVLRYRVNYNNSPVAGEYGVSCMLSFNQKMSDTFVPYGAIIGWKAEGFDFGFNIPVREDNFEIVTGNQMEKDTKPTLRVVK